MWTQPLSIQWLGVKFLPSGTSLIMKCIVAYGQLCPCFHTLFLCTGKLRIHINSTQWLDEVKHKFSITKVRLSFTGDLFIHPSIHF